MSEINNRASFLIKATLLLLSLRVISTENKIRDSYTRVSKVRECNGNLHKIKNKMRSTKNKVVF